MPSASNPTKAGDIEMLPARFLGSDDAVLFDERVVPEYLALFSERLLEAIVPGPDARVCHVHCRTGYPDKLLLARLPNAHVYGCDASPFAIEIASARARLMKGLVFDYRVNEGPLTPFPAGAFSHAFTLHPLAAPAERTRIFEELARIVAPSGQALVAMPLRGSFVEIADLLRECALKNEHHELMRAVDAAMHLRPTDEVLRREFASVGFDHVDVDVRTRTLKFENGSALFDAPATRLLLLPEFRANLHAADDEPFAYVRDAIDKYWSDAPFELTVNIGVVNGRRSLVNIP
jgi:SAM-dependent methyltransferase